ncbi:hypothetical protein [Planktotalea arctica]|uniref:hypothetical protein n=1 Tax=Planktotalea arctica TaxID=1481893 RepID=UPI001593C9BA|nr:hypothetical protein [Planktotalea arctica]
MIYPDLPMMGLRRASGGFVKADKIVALPKISRAAGLYFIPATRPKPAIVRVSPS